MTREFIENKIATDDRWLEKGILAIFKYQTEHEKKIVGTCEWNGVGFNGADGSFMTSIGLYLHKAHYRYNKPIGTILSSKQKYVARKRMMKYSGQLLKIAEQKKQADVMDQFYAEQLVEAKKADQWLQDQFNSGKVKFSTPELQANYERQLRGEI